MAAVAAAAVAAAVRRGGVTAAAAAACRGVPTAAAVAAPLGASMPVAAAARVAAAAAGVRHMGLLDRLRAGVADGFKDKAEAKKREMFQMQLDFLASSASYTMFDHIGVLKRMEEAAGVGGWKAALRTKAQQAEIDEQFQDIKIGDALTAEERGDPTIVRRREKLRIASAVGVDVSRVNRFMDGYDQSKMVHEWIQGRKARGLPLPTTMEDYFALMVADKVGLKDRKAAMHQQMGNVRTQRAMLRKM